MKQVSSWWETVAITTVITTALAVALCYGIYQTLKDERRRRKSLIDQNWEQFRKYTETKAALRSAEHEREYYKRLVYDWHDTTFRAVAKKYWQQFLLRLGTRLVSMSRDT